MGWHFFVTGVVVALESGRNSQLALTPVLPFLAAFGLPYGIHEWMEMFLRMSSENTRALQLLNILSIVLLAASFVLLIEFAVRLMRLLLVDDHAIVRAGLRMLLELQPHMEFVGECDTGRDAGKQIGDY